MNTTDCAMTVAAAAPVMPNPNVKISSGSKMMFRTSPVALIMNGSRELPAPVNVPVIAAVT